MAGVTVAAAIGGAAVIGGITSYLGAQEQADAAKQAAQTQAESNAAARDLQYKMFQEQKELQKPWYDVGVSAVNRLQKGLAAGGEFATPFSQTNWQQDPGYAFRLKEGQRALDQSAAARGGLISGNALKAAQRYGQEMGSQEYQNAFNRYYAERQNMLQPIQSLAGVGQTTATNIAGEAGAYGQLAGANLMSTGASNANALLAQGNARASQYGAIGNAIGGAAGAYGNYLTGQQNQQNFNSYLNVLSGLR